MNRRWAFGGTVESALVKGEHGVDRAVGIEAVGLDAVVGLCLDEGRDRRDDIPRAHVAREIDAFDSLKGGIGDAQPDIKRRTQRSGRSVSFDIGAAEGSEALFGCRVERAAKRSPASNRASGFPAHGLPSLSSFGLVSAEFIASKPP